MKKLFLIVLLFCSFLVNSTNVFAIDWGSNNKTVDIKIDLAIIDTNGENVPLETKVIWKNAKRNKTHTITNSLGSNLVSMRKKIDEKELGGYLYFKKVVGEKRTFDKDYNVKINYDFGGSSTLKSELFYLVVEKNRDTGFFELKEFLAKKEKDEKDKQKVEVAKVMFTGEILSSHIFNEGAKIGIYDDEGKVIWETNFGSDGKFAVELTGFRDKIKIGKEYYIIYGKDGNVEEGEIGFFYDSDKVVFESYLDFINFFQKDYNVSFVENIKDKPLIEPFPYWFAIILLGIYGSVVFFFIWKEFVRKIFIHPFLKRNKVICEKKKKIILELKNQ